MRELWAEVPSKRLSSPLLKLELSGFLSKEEKESSFRRYRPEGALDVLDSESNRPTAIESCNNFASSSSMISDGRLEVLKELW